MFHRSRPIALPSALEPTARSVVLLVGFALAFAACSTGGAATAPTPAPTIAASPSASPSALASPTATPAFPTTLTDDEGTSVEIAQEPQRIVSLTPAATETLFALGLGDRIAGKGEDVFLYPPQAGSIPDVATFDGVDIEKIVSMEPDVVFAGGNFFTPPDAIERMRDLGLPVVVLYAASVDDVYGDIELIGRASGRSAQATDIAARIRSEFDAVEAAVAGLARPRIFYELDATGAIYGPADDSFLAEMIQIAGGDPITTGAPDKYEISIERLIQADPELILLADAPFGVTVDQVVARPGWDVMTAVREGQIRPIDDQTVTRPGPRLFLGLQLLAATIHPDAEIPSSGPIPPSP